MILPQERYRNTFRLTDLRHQLAQYRNGDLAPNAKLRSEIIPGSKKNKRNVSDTNDAVPHSSAYLPAHCHDHLRKSLILSTYLNRNSDFSALFLIELISPPGRLSRA
ncbi:hypothetical protein [Nitrosomonas sp. Nm166]|uniref:hypothetical protein n=1 Tax=Nitrosomonas sp. Nm166 TaxID=1881054 RepID=UPI0015A5BE32